MSNFFWTNSDEDYKGWDRFLSATKRGHYLQISHWLKSHRVYGFKVDLLLIKDDNSQIIGGAGLIISKFGFFKFCIVNCGPIIKEGHEELFNPIVKEILSRCRLYKPISISINFPILEKKNNNLSPFCLDIKLDDQIFKRSKKGSVINAVSSIDGFREVPIYYGDDIDSEIFLFNNFTKSTRRDVRYSLKNNLNLEFAKSNEELEEAYMLLEQNAKNQNYSIRPWKDFKKTLVNMVKDKTCIVPTCRYKGVLKAALIVLNVGKRFTYLAGGSIREKPDLQVSRFLQFQILRLSIEKGYSFYDISVGGSKGVTKFKEGFGSKHRRFIGYRYWVERKTLFWIYIKFLPFLKRNKVFISKILKYFNK